MSLARPRSLAAGGPVLALSLALVAASPASALAVDGSPSEKGKGQGKGRPSPSPTATAAPKKAEQQEKPEKTQQRTPAPRRTTSTPRPTRSAQAGPPGNNGTIKVDGAPFDSSRGNEPHVGCDVRIVFWGFDALDTASITFTAQAPTGAGTPLHRESGTVISRDAAGGGQDLDEALVFGVDGALSELRAIAPHPEQGWHVKVAVDVDSAPGGAKQKVFWMQCPAAAADAVAPATPLSGGTTARSTRTTVVPVEQAAPAADAQVLGAAGEAATVDAVAAAPRAVARTVRAQAATRPSALPFTGPVAFGLLAAIGGGSLLAGGAAHRLGRRQASSPPSTTSA